MASSGGGTMLPISPGVSPSTVGSTSCVTLPRYAQRIHQNECAFWGVANPAEVEIGYGCDTIWSKWMRDDIQFYLTEAQQEIEQQVNYPICAKWFADEQHAYSCPIQADWGWIIEPGIMAVEEIASDELVDYTDDPAVIGPMAVTFTSTDEVAIFYPGTDYQIYPETIQITGGELTIWIPRCRMVAFDKLENPKEGWDYDDLANFTESVDVKRIFNDPSVNAELVWPNGCRGCATCTERTQTACMYINNNKVGSVMVHPATYTEENGWSRAANIFCCHSHPQKVRLNYKAGLPLTKQMEDTIIRLAHSKMPDELCGCETFMRHWRRDRFVPEILTRERLNCPFGTNEGAWIAWRFTQSQKMYRGATF